MSRRALWSPTTPGADPATANGVPQSPTAAPVSALPARSAPTLPAGSAVDTSVAFARLATLFTEAAGILHQIAQVPLAVRAQEALMCSVKEPAASARLLTAEDLAARLQVDARTIRRWRRAGRIPAGIEIAGVVRWTPESIDAWVASGGRA